MLVEGGPEITMHKSPFCHEDLYLNTGRWVEIASLIQRISHEPS